MVAFSGANTLLVEGASSLFVETHEEPPDAGAPDAGTPEPGPPDVGTPDARRPDVDVRTPETPDARVRPSPKASGCSCEAAPAAPPPAALLAVAVVWLARRRRR
jgi:MYXO-CTERM domain-containing protein